ncbi:MAG: hypothetical protein U5L45_11425 [Saprospiraceae bacterium]|nr:hypothetical protein [Saprospiraceae bacterium]
MFRFWASPKIENTLFLRAKRAIKIKSENLLYTLIYLRFENDH